MSGDKGGEVLLKEVSLEEKVGLMMESWEGVEGLGMKGYKWWKEGVEGVGGGGLGRVFGEGIGMGGCLWGERVYEVLNGVWDEGGGKNRY